MIVRLKLGSSPPSNKPPPPEPTPSKPEYPTVLDVEGSKIWVSVPKPDKLTIVGPIRPDHFTSAFQADGPDSYGRAVMRALASGAVGDVAKGAKGTQWSKDPLTGVYTFKAVVLEIGPGKGAINFKLDKAADPYVHKLRVELNPASLGEEGVLDLLDRWHAATEKTFRVGAFLRDAHLTRIDAAIDFIGLQPPDLLISAVGSGSGMAYVGGDDELETVYRFRKKQAPVIGDATSIPLKAKGPGTMLVRVYDKVRERASVGMPPPFGPAPVTRVEVSKIGFGGKPPKVGDLPGLSNLLSKLRIGHLAQAKPAGCDQWTWQQYVHARRGGGPTRAVSVLGLTPASAARLNAAYLQHPSDLLDTDAAWAGWGTGLKLTSLIHLVEAAAHGSSASYMTDFSEAMETKNST